MAHMSLEVVIGFVILLVVSAVVIGLIFTNINSNPLPTKDTELSQMSFKNKCKTLCADTNSIEYCRYYFRGNKNKVFDWDGNGIERESISIGNIITWEACEDRIYCFLVVPCERFGSNPIKGCADALCNAYLQKYEGDVLEANEAVFDKIKKGSCSLPANKKDNWFLEYFPEDVCGCDCTTWKDVGCGTAFGCNPGEMYQNRSCLPKGCRESTERCINSSKC